MRGNRERLEEPLGNGFIDGSMMVNEHTRCEPLDVVNQERLNMDAG